MVFNFGHQIFFTDIKQFLLAHGLNIFKWVVAGGIFPKDEVEQQQHMYFKNKVFTRQKYIPAITINNISILLMTRKTTLPNISL
jgi:methylmalonyl-CoA mutase cobalamin-binding subunit